MPLSTAIDMPHIDQQKERNPMELMLKKKSLGAICLALSLSLAGCNAAGVHVTGAQARSTTETPALEAATPIQAENPTPGAAGAMSPTGVDVTPVGVDVPTLEPDTTALPTTTTSIFLPGNAAANGGTSVSGGGGSGGGGATTTPVATALTVNGVTPISGTGTAPTNGILTATFTRAMLASTVNATTFKLHNLTTATDVAGTVTYVGTTATFRPTVPLTASTAYRATITTGIQDTAGVALASDHAWTFTTGAVTDTGAPTVHAATTPIGGATGIALNANVKATFSEAIDPATITGTTFTLMHGVTPVPGIVTHAGNTATFNPTSNLALNTTYTATVTTGAKDLAGNALAANYSWNFTTQAFLTGQLPVSLGAALSQYAVLAYSTVTNTGGSVITGDLGLSPGSAVTGFPPGTVNGMQHVTDPSAAQAKLELTTAYNDAAGRTLAPIVAAGNIGGLTYTPGLYKSVGSLEITSGDLTFDAQGNANAVFIIQIASSFTTTAGRQVILAGGAKAANIFWQVGTSATLGTNSVMKGIIMADQSVTLNSGAALEGRALARIGAVTLANNVVTIPAL